MMKKGFVVGIEAMIAVIFIIIMIAWGINFVLKDIARVTDPDSAHHPFISGLAPE